MTRERTRCRDGLLRRRANTGNAGCGRPAPPARSRPEDPCHQRREFDETATTERASAWPIGPRFRCALHQRQANRFRLPRLSVAYSSTNLPAYDHKNLHVRGYKEEGTTSTPFDMVVRNDLDRFHLFGDVIDRLPQLGVRARPMPNRRFPTSLLEHKEYIAKYGDDMPEITGWQWGQASAKAATGNVRRKVTMSSGEEST